MAGVSGSGRHHPLPTLNSGKGDMQCWLVGVPPGGREVAAWRPYSPSLGDIPQGAHPGRCGSTLWKVGQGWGQGRATSWSSGALRATASSLGIPSPASPLPRVPPRGTETSGAQGFSGQRSWSSSNKQQAAMPGPFPTICWAQ